MKILTTLSAASTSILLLVSCGGEPIDYCKKTDQSVFVWRQTAYAEHPAVASDGDQGTPLSARKALMGKTFSVAFTLNGEERIFVVNFISQVRCTVRTNIRLVVPEGTTVEYPNATYNYIIDNNEGTEATLAVSFDSAATTNQCSLKLVFVDVFNATPTTFLEFRNGDGIVVVPAQTRATTARWTLTPN